MRSTKTISDEDASRLKNLMWSTLGRIKTQKSFPSAKQINRVVTPDDMPDRSDDTETSNQSDNVGKSNSDEQS